MRRGIWGVVAAVAIPVLAAPPATAATTIGQTAPDSASVAGLGGPTLIVQDQVAGPPGYTIPDGGGVITSWSVQGGTMPSYPVKLKLVTRDADPTSFTFVGEDTQRPIASGVLNRFETRIPVSGGELLALWVGTALETSAAYFNAAPGDIARFGGGGPHQEPEIGQSFQTDTPLNGARVNVSAILEPDCDADGFGDETQDPELPPTQACDPNVPQATITKAPKNKTKKRTATFEFTGTDARAVASFECSLDGAAFTTCTSPHTVKVKKGKHTFEVRAVDQAGNVGAPASDTWKRKRKKK